MGSGNDAPPGWSEICRIMTASLKKHGAFHWTEIATQVGEETCEKMQWQRGNCVWRVDPALVSPRPRRSLLDHVSVAEADLHGGSSRHVRIGPSDPPDRDSRTPHLTCAAAPLGAKTLTRIHTIDNPTLKEAPTGFLQCVVESLYTEITLEIERAVCGALFRTDASQFASSVQMPRRSDRMTIREEDPLSASLVAGAAAAISQSCRDVPFPDGLVCLASPAQAMQMTGDSEERARSMSVGGVGVLPTPTIEFDQSHERYVAFVAARRSIDVALSHIEIDTSAVNNGVQIVAQYAMGTRIDPLGTVRIESWRR